MSGNLRRLSMLRLLSQHRRTVELLERLKAERFSVSNGAALAAARGLAVGESTTVNIG